jgi:hypothetical protein
VDTTRLRNHATMDTRNHVATRAGENRRVETNSQSINKIGICGNHSWYRMLLRGPLEG